MNGRRTVLDLPIEEQRELAERRGMSLEEWQEESRKSLKAGEEHRKKMDANTVYWEDLSLAEQVAHKRFLRKMASATHNPDDDVFLRYTPEELKFLEQENQENI